MNPIALAHGAAAAAALSAGAAVVATRYVIGETDALTLVFHRYVIGAACFAPFLPALRPRQAPCLRDWGRIAAFGLLFFLLFPWAFNAALRHIPAARGAVGLAAIPIQTLVVAAAFGREALTAAKAIGVLLAFGGILLAYGTAALRGGPELAGDGLMLLGVLCAAVYSVFARPTLMRHGPLFVTAMGMACAVAVLLPLAAAMGTVVPALSGRGWAAVIFLGSVAGAGQFSLFMWALRWLPPTTTVLYLTLNPLAAMVLGVVLLGEAVTAELCAGFVLVLAGIAVGAGLAGPAYIRLAARRAMRP